MESKQLSPIFILFALVAILALVLYPGFETTWIILIKNILLTTVSLFIFAAILLPLCDFIERNHEPGNLKGVFLKKD